MKLSPLSRPSRLSVVAKATRPNKNGKTPKNGDVKESSYPEASVDGPTFGTPRPDVRDHLVNSGPSQFRSLRRFPQTRHTTEFTAQGLSTDEDTFLVEVSRGGSMTGRGAGATAGGANGAALALPHMNGLEGDGQLINVRSRTVSGDDLGPSSSQGPSSMHSPIIMVTRPLPRVLLLHTGGTLGMDKDDSFEPDALTGGQRFKSSGGRYQKALQPGKMLSNIKAVLPELSQFANLDLEVVMNVDSCRVGPREWIRLAQILHKSRDAYDAFLVVHGTDTMAYTASALSLMLLGFRKPIVMTGSQLPLTTPRSDARQNLIDSLTCATAAHVPPHVHLQEVTVCFGGRLLRGNRSQKVNSSAYQAFDSPTYPHLATLGVDVEWKEQHLLRDRGVYRPRFKMNPNVIRVPIVPGCDPRQSYGDLAARGVRGIVLEAFGVGNLPDTTESGWIPWLRDQRGKGLQIYLASQCRQGPLHPELYRSGSVATEKGLVESALTQMSVECAVVKMMMTLEYPSIPMGVPLAGEL